MKYTLNLFFAFVFIGISFHGFSQSMPVETPKNEKKSIKERIFLGGEVGLQFGTITFINLSPFVGYKITERLLAGIGPKYLYYKDKFYTPAYSTSMYGGRVFGRYFITPNIFAHAEYELLNLETFFGRRENVESIFVGGGFRQPIGQKSYVSITGLWNINESIYSPYVNPIIRIEFISSL